jgi:type II secretory pathway pseudopilin PulG
MRGHTTLELLIVMAVMGIATASLAPTARKLRDRSAVVAAREALVGVLAEARIAAMTSGRSTVRITADPARVEALVGDSTIRDVAIGAEYGVAVALNGEVTSVEIGFDALGLGRMAGQTIGFRRGDLSSELVVSSYGRVRRR